MGYTAGYKARQLVLIEYTWVAYIFVNIDLDRISITHLTTGFSYFT